MTTGKKASESFAQHEKSSIHNEAVLIHSVMKQPSVSTQLNIQLVQEQRVNREILLKQLTSLRYILRQGLALQGHEEKEGNLMQLLYLRSDDSPGMKQYIENKKYLSHEIIHKQLGLMVNNILR